MALAHSRLLEFTDDLEPLQSDTELGKLANLVTRYRNAVTKMRPGGLFTVQADLIAETSTQASEDNTETKDSYDVVDVAVDAYYNRAAPVSSETTVESTKVKKKKKTAEASKEGFMEMEN